MEPWKPEVKDNYGFYKGVMGRDWDPAAATRHMTQARKERVPLSWNLDTGNAQHSHDGGSDQFSGFHLLLRLSMMNRGLYLWLKNNQKLAVSAFI